MKYNSLPILLIITCINITSSLVLHHFDLIKRNQKQTKHNPLKNLSNSFSFFAYCRLQTAFILRIMLEI